MLTCISHLTGEGMDEASQEWGIHIWYISYIWRRTFTFRAFSRCFYPKRLTISTFVIRSETLHRCWYSKEVHRTKVQKCKYQQSLG